MSGAPNLSNSGWQVESSWKVQTPGHHSISFRVKNSFMYLRFVSQTRVGGTSSRAGLIATAYDFRRNGIITSQECESLTDVLEWFERNLPVPPRFSRSKSKGFYRRDVTYGLSWFKPDAGQAVRKAFELAGILERNHLPIDLLKTRCVGYVIYEDRFQVVAEPFSDTPT